LRGPLFHIALFFLSVVFFTALFTAFLVAFFFGSVNLGLVLLFGFGVMTRDQAFERLGSGVAWEVLRLFDGDECINLGVRLRLDLSQPVGLRQRQET